MEELSPRRVSFNTEELDKTPNNLNDTLDNYSILMYETQDAFLHSKKLMSKLKTSQERLAEKVKQHTKAKIEIEDYQKCIFILKNDVRRKDKNIKKLKSQNEKLKTLLDDNNIEFEIEMKDVDRTLIDDDETKSRIEKDLPGERPEEEEKEVITEEFRGELNRAIIATHELANRNDRRLQTVIEECGALLRNNSDLLSALQEENDTSVRTVERWTHDYMELNERAIKEQEMSRRRQSQSEESERRYKFQIRSLCEMINRLNVDVTNERLQTDGVKATLEKVVNNLETLDENFERISNVASEKVQRAECRVRQLVQRCDQMKLSPTFKSKVKNTSKGLFKLKKKFSDAM